MPNRALVSSSAAKISNFEPLHDSFQKNQKKKKKRTTNPTSGLNLKSFT